MTRTKTGRRLVSKKRGSVDEKTRIANKMRDFEVTVDCELANLELKFRDEMDRVQRLVDGLKTRIPKKYLTMTINQIREYQEEAEKIEASFYGDRTAVMAANLSVLLEKSARKKSKDDGYLTEESDHPERLSAMSSASKRVGPLMSAKFRRRSKSAGGVTNTSTVNRSLYQNQTATLVDRSALGKTLGTSVLAKDRNSRAKAKTPMPNRPKAISVDRIYGAITPKVQPNSAMAILRHARLGEPVYAITGSPVITANILESTANVNIPVENGMLSIRPTEMGTVDPAMVSKIDPHVLAELKQLQENLNVIMRTLKL
ncbi:borealin isoform X1 [Culex quinquefasciatus]|uniref:borealin isoform X1 n=1 Tax=Culex quinquefasciatus TaxID=7176 RepID=UPI0018E3F53C|nr:borealin isoform X1 [Culex quinquefasciatus]XP_039442920.1 borealin-like isoform X1 [Culex pipiens pallens]